MAALIAGAARVALFDLPTRTVSYLDTGLKDMTVARWAPVGPHLAVASAKGAAIVYRKDSRKRTPVDAKHSKAVTCAEWSRDGTQLALGCNDNTVSISSAAGEQLETLKLPGPVSAVKFAPPGGAVVTSGTSSGGRGPVRLAVAVGKSVLLYGPPGEAGREAGVTPGHGRVGALAWLPEGYLAVAFAGGALAIVATLPPDEGQQVFLTELSSPTALQGSVGGGKAAAAAAASGASTGELPVLAYCPAAQLLALGLGGQVRLLDVHTWRESPERFCALEGPVGVVAQLCWSADGQLLAAATSGGSVAAFVVRVPPLFAASSQGRVALLSSL